MPDFYYADMVFDPEADGLGEVVDGCVSAIVGSGARFHRVQTARAGTRETVDFAQHVSIKPQDLGALALAYFEDGGEEDSLFVSFPPRGGRVMFEMDFLFDELEDEVAEEEEASGISATDLGLTFSYRLEGGRITALKATVSFWDEFVLSHGRPDAHVHNIRMVLAIIEAINERVPIVFAALNNEIHLDSSVALEDFSEGQINTTNEFVFLNPDLCARLNISRVRQAGIAFASMRGGGMMLQLANRWGVQTL